MADAQKSKWTYIGLIEAPVEQVWDALLQVSPLLAHVDHQAVTQGPAVQHLNTTFGEPAIARISVDIDRHQHVLATQGEWWYRGVYTIELHPRGSLLAYRVYNVAPPGSRWLVPFVTRQYPAALQASFQQVLQALGECLSCSAVLIAN